MSNTTIFDSRYTKLKTIDWNFQDVSQDALANIHPYPARFIPDIPRELISALGCAKGSVVLDPFAGVEQLLLKLSEQDLMLLVST